METGRAIESSDDVKQVLKSARTVAVIGAHPDARRPAHYVPAYLKSAGYRVLPVNPRFVGETLFGEPCVATLDLLSEPVDVVDVFRRSEDVPGHLDEILKMTPLPRLVWLQQGIRNDDVAAQLMARGIDVVQDRCMLADHQRML